MPADPEALRYFEFHRERYRFLLDLISPLLRPGACVLDIGLSSLPRAILSRCPEVRMATLGFDDPRYHALGEWPHFECDLNDSAFDWNAIGRYDLIICAEVIEHLHTPPAPVLRNLAAALNPAGQIVLQTPNAASLEKRLKLLLGSNPYQMISGDPRNPGHFREYTVGELKAIAAEAGLAVSHVSVENYFRPSTARGRAYNAICRFLPNNLRDGITLMGTVHSNTNSSPT